MDLIERDKVMHEIDQLSHAWEYGNAVDDCYEIVKKAPTVEAIPISWFHAKSYSWEKDLKTACREDAESIRHIQDTYLGMIEEWRKEE